ncbi:riboflavin synthase alpha chain [Raineyella antarctica]|uniref:Riboflavin synthase n=1 Tax=Raineyella antarctica TaxID=1577474 RepID=A0A1G6HA44_9ACTN|nr:riboflavin synthase [Raineyella antarctica]SDB91140.1 riboflavin synthase alpha chain [Raineyella antarctica]
MFTGIVEEVGEIVDLRHGEESAVLRVRGPLVTSDAHHGDSISVNGVCLTVTDLNGDTFGVDVMAETLARSGLGGLAVGSPVNLERAMAATGRLGGHLVQGHVDGTGTVRSRTPGEAWEVVEIALAPELSRYLVEKGSITIDGVSLTVVEVRPDAFTVSLIPTTLAETTLGALPVGAMVNLEVDVIGKYVATYLDRIGTGWATQDGDK